MDADAFELFLEKGIFDSKTATSFVNNILSKGGTEHPMILYKKFRGKEPDPSALLRRAGLSWLLLSFLKVWKKTEAVLLTNY